mmetsp:Transcript_17759/g.57492  ORF Transcript_17759/g.57492 Transcript_17759/m.57492 type:complete len:107 (+) Transcript_17759:390-710(+)
MLLLLIDVRRQSMERCAHRTTAWTIETMGFSRGGPGVFLLGGRGEIRRRGSPESRRRPVLFVSSLYNGLSIDRRGRRAVGTTDLSADVTGSLSVRGKRGDFASVKG